MGKNAKEQVTIGIYRKEPDAVIENPEEMGHVSNGFSGAAKEMLEIINGIRAAAESAGNEPPEITVSFLLIPNWASKREEMQLEGIENPIKHYESDSYNENKNIHINLFRAAIDADKNGITVIDCLKQGELTESEKEYMENLTALGSNADIIKTRAIIENHGKKHLQLDSNTKIIDFNELYNTTFGKEDNSDAFNASYYDENYVSVHNKIVYISDDSEFPLKLQGKYQEYCGMVNGQDDPTELKTKNAIYSKVFTGAAVESGIARIHQLNNGKTVFPAKMENQDAFRLTSQMFTAVNKSWDANDVKPKGFDELCKLSKEGNDSNFDYACYNISRKKLIGVLDAHPINDDGGIDVDEAKKQLMDISNMDIEREEINKFEKNIVEKIANDQNCPKAEMLGLVFNSWPDGNLKAVECITNSNLTGDQQYHLLQEFFNQANPKHYDKTDRAILEMIKSNEEFSVDQKESLVEAQIQYLERPIDRWLFNRVVKDPKPCQASQFSMYSQSGYNGSPKTNVQPSQESPSNDETFGGPSFNNH